jgi:hypothetical protein
VSVFGTGGSLIPTIWGLSLGFYIPSRKGAAGCSGPEVLARVTTFQIMNELGLQNFLTMQVKEL